MDHQDALHPEDAAPSPALVPVAATRAGEGVSVHPSALVESDQVGARTRVWAFTHIQREARVGADCNIGGHCYIESGAFVGDRVTIKNGTAVWSGVTLETGVFVGPAVVFTNDLRPRSPRLGVSGDRYESPAGWLSPTLVGTGATLGAGSTVVAGVEIGAFAFVGAGTLVTRDVPPRALVLGHPGRVVGWVCRCGGRLAGEDGEGTCAQCGAAYPAGEEAGRA